MAKKPTLSSLSNRLAKKDAPAASQAPVEAIADDIEDAGAEAAPKGYTLTGKPRVRAPKGQGDVDPRKAMLVRADPKVWKRMKMLALDDERPLQDLLTDAINDYLKKRGS